MVKAYEVKEMKEVEKQVTYVGIVNCPNCKTKFCVSLEVEKNANMEKKT